MYADRGVKQIEEQTRRKAFAAYRCLMTRLPTVTRRPSVCMYLSGNILNQPPVGAPPSYRIGKWRPPEAAPGLPSENIELIAR